MNINVTLTLNEAHSIVMDHISRKYETPIENINVVITVQNFFLDDFTLAHKNERREIVAKIRSMLPNSKMEAIKVFRASSGSLLKDSKNFVENSKWWPEYIETGFFPKEA